MLRLRPETLLGQLWLALSGLLLASSLLSLLIFRSIIIDPSARHLGGLLANQLALLEQLPPEALPPLPGLTLMPQRPAAATQVPDLYYLSSLTAALQARRTVPTPLWLQRTPQRRLWVQLATVPPRWVGFDLAQFEGGLSWFVGYWLALLSGGSLLAAYGLARYFTHPLRVLAQAATALGQRQPLPPLPPGGNAELRALQQALQASAEALSRLEAERNLLLAGISHDLRTPLTRMQLGLEMLTDPDAELLHGLQADIAEMAQTINQFIDFVRGSHAESLQDTDLNALITQVTQRYAAFGTAPQLTLAPLPALPLRPQALRRLLTNLLDNAYRHGHGQVWLTTAQQGGLVCLTVRDAGPGLPESFLETALKPYTRLDGARGSPGTGLGLAIVERIAQAHQGEVRLSNHPEGGLVVTVTLPVV